MAVHSNVESVLQEIQNTVEFLGVDLTDPNQKGIFGNTPLKIAIAWGDCAAVKLLLDAGADVNATLEDDQTPLHEAARLGNSSIAALLVERGALLNARNKFGDTPIDMARSRGYGDVVDFLLKAKA